MRRPVFLLAIVIVLALAVLGSAVGTGGAFPGASSVDARANVTIPVASSQSAERAIDPKRAVDPPASDRTLPRGDEPRPTMASSQWAAESSSTSPARSLAPPDDVEPPPALGLKDRIGGRDAMMASLRAEFEPLAAECIDDALERSPDLAGMLALGFQVVPDPEHGAIVESLEPTDDNEVADAELVECIRQTMLSTSLPAIDEREALMITMPIGDDQ